jgi:hypothetical protein
MRAAAILLCALAASGVSAADTVSVVPAPALVPAPDAEIYVAELDRDWTVTREVRLRCEAARGCAADLDGPTRVRVRFEPHGVGAVSVSSRIEDAAGQGTDQPALTLTLDGKGFGAGHIEAVAGGAGRVLMLAVQAPALVGPGARALAGDRI